MTRAAFIDAEVPEPTAAWMESVRADLRKASARFGSLLRNEAEANMAVFLADAEVEAAIEARGKHATALKERNVAAVAAVNKSEAELADELADGANRTWSTIPDTNPTKLEPLMSAYKQALEERATTIYVCTTQTLAGRQTVARMTKKRDACRKHLVSIVAERNEAETEMARIHGLLVDKTDDGDELLALQLECVAPADTPLVLAQRCTPTDFDAQCAISHDVFKSE